MGAAVMLLAAFTSACTRSEPPLRAALLDVATEVGARMDRAEAGREVERIAARVKKAGQGDLVAALRAVVFEQLGYVREVDDLDLAYVLLPSVLGGRKGTCVGLGTLYLVVAEALGRTAELEAVIVPGHFFLRAPAPSGRRNVELLRQGEVVDDEFYERRYALPADPVPAYLRPLSRDEIAAVVRFNAGNDRREAGRLEEAATLYRRAATGFPDFAEAHASLGLTLHLLGRVGEARAAYAAAARAHPSLPGLARNIEALGAP